MNNVVVGNSPPTGMHVGNGRDRSLQKEKGVI